MPAILNWALDGMERLLKRGHLTQPTSGQEIIRHVLATGRPYQDLGVDHFTTRIDPEIETRRLVAKLQSHGYTVTLEPAA